MALPTAFCVLSNAFKGGPVTVCLYASGNHAVPACLVTLEHLPVPIELERDETNSACRRPT